MAENREILIEVNIDKSGAEQQLKDTSALIEQVNRNTKALSESSKELEKRNKTLNEQFKAGAISRKTFNSEVQKNNAQIAENSRKIALNRDESKKLNASRNQAIKALNTENNSLNAQRQNLSKLVEERNNVNLSTKEGKKRFEELNKAILVQNESLKKAEEAGGDFRRSVGNYQKALDGVAPGLSGAASGFVSMTKAALAFIATPIGAIIGALGLALGALVTFLTKTQKGIEIMRIASASVEVVFAKLTDTVSSVGEALFNAFSDPKQAILDFGSLISDVIIGRIRDVLEGFKLLGKSISELFSGNFEEAGNAATTALKKISGFEAIENVIDNVGESFSNLSNDIQEAAVSAGNLEASFVALEKRENNLILLRSKANQQIAEQRFLAEDRTKSEEERIAAIEKAFEIENNILAQEISNAKERANLIVQQNSLSKSTEEDRKRELEALAKVNDLETASFNLRKSLQSRLEGIRNEKRRQDEADEAAEKARIQAEKDAAFELELFRQERDAQEIEDARLKAEALIEIERFKLEKELENKALLDEERILLEEETAQRITEINKEADKKISDNKAKTEELNRKQDGLRLQSLQSTLGGINALLGAFGAKQKSFAIAQATIDGIVAIQKALASAPPPLNVPAVIATTAQQAANVISISRQKFADGGIVNGPSHARGGVKFSVGGVVNELEGGEGVINKRAMAIPKVRAIASSLNQIGGGKKFATGGIIGSSMQNVANQVNAEAALSDIITSQPTPVVRVTEINEVNNAVKVTEDTARL